MRLATFNLLHGRSLSDGLVEVTRLHEAVQTLAADVVGLQEVDRDQPRSHGLDLTAEAAEAMGAKDFRFVSAISGTPGERWTAATGGESGPAYGIGLVSRLPVREWRVLRLPAAPIRSPIMIPGTRQVIWLRDEPRVVVAAVLEELTVATTHLSFAPGWNVRQLRRTIAWLGTLPGPQVLLGDLNMPLPVARLASGWTSLVAAKSYPGPNPKVQLDAVLASQPLAVLDTGSHLLPLSDHRALTVDLC